MSHLGSGKTFNSRPWVGEDLELRAVGEAAYLDLTIKLHSALSLHCQIFLNLAEGLFILTEGVEEGNDREPNEPNAHPMDAGCKGQWRRAE